MSFGLYAPFDIQKFAKQINHGNLSLTILKLGSSLMQAATQTSPSLSRASTAATPSSLTDDAFLGGKLQILQPEKGYRAGIDAVFLAASIPAVDGETVFEAGIGAGVAAMC